jgi:hypothetical protein
LNRLQLCKREVPRHRRSPLHRPSADTASFRSRRGCTASASKLPQVLLRDLGDRWGHPRPPIDPGGQKWRRARHARMHGKKEFRWVEWSLAESGWGAVGTLSAHWHGPLQFPTSSTWNRSRQKKVGEVGFRGGGGGSDEKKGCTRNPNPELCCRLSPIAHIALMRYPTTKVCRHIRNSATAQQRNSARVCHIGDSVDVAALRQFRIFPGRGA